MFFKILFVTSLITISLDATDPQRKSNHATYSHSFVREDVPLSYKYSAVHTYGSEGRGALEEPNLTKNVNNPELKPIHTHIQYAPLPNPREKPYETNNPVPTTEDNSYETKSVLYTSVTANPAHEYRQYKKLNNKDHLEPKPAPIDVKYIKPFTYKPHINQNFRVLQSPQNSFLANYYQNNRYPVIATTEAAQLKEMADALKYFNPYQQGQHLKQPFNYVPAKTTESPRNSYIVGISNTFLPKHAMYQEQSIPIKAIPFEYNTLLELQTVPRMAYLNSFKSRETPSETPGGRPQKYSRYNQVKILPKMY